MLEVICLTGNLLMYTNIFDIYGLGQLITEPTRVTLTSKTLIDLCITNSQEKVTDSGVIHLGISDHSLVFLTRKAQYYRNGPRVIETRHFKHFDKGKFLSDLNRRGQMLTCIRIQMICGVNGKRCFLDALISMHHLN